MHHLTFPILFSEFIYCYGIAYSVRRVGFHSYNLLSALLLTSIRIFLNAGSFFANLPAVSGVSSTLAYKIFTGLWHLWNQIIQLMQFSRYKRDFFECPFTYYSLETPKCCSLQKILSLIKPDRRILPTSFCNNLQKVFIHICTFAFMRIFIVLSF